MPSLLQVVASHGGAVAEPADLGRSDAGAGPVSVVPAVWLADDGSGGGGALSALTPTGFVDVARGDGAPRKRRTNNAFTAAPGEITRCRFCPYSSESPINVSRHERSHTGVKPFACVHCTYRSAR